MAFEIGAQVGPYRIEEKIGRGGMATVYKAYHDRLDRHVAIKVLHPAIIEDASFIGRFEREARVVANLDHPNIVPVYDFAEHEGRPYLVMKYIQGETLKERLAKGAVRTEEGLRIVEAIGSALAFAHQRGVLHRDVKPSNVMLTGDGGVFLADFGLARLAAAGESTISQDTLLGTPHYISPEQAKGVRDLGAETDIYSFGVMLFELVVGRVPFIADTPFSIIHDHIYTPLPSPRDLNPNVPEAMEQVLKKALAKEPADRYSSASDLAADFHRASTSQLPGTATEQHAFSVSPRASTVGAVAAQTVVAADADAAAPDTDTPARGTIAAGVAEVSTVTVSEPKRARPWGWIVAGLFALALLFVVGAVFAWQYSRQAAPPEPTVALPTGLPPGTPLPGGAVDNPPEPPQDIPPIPELELPADLEPAVANRIERAYAKLVADPTDPGRYIDLAAEFYQAGLTEPALETLEQGAEVANFAPEYYLDAAKRAQDLEEVVGTLAILEQGLLRHPLDPRLRTAAAAAMLAAPRENNALPILESYQENFPDWVTPQVTIARWYGFHGDLPRAEEILYGLLEEHPHDPEVQLAHGDFLLATGDTEGAIEMYRAVLDNPDTSPFLRHFAEQQLERAESGGGRIRPT